MATLLKPIVFKLKMLTAYLLIHFESHICFNHSDLHDQNQTRMKVSEEYDRSVHISSVQLFRVIY